jgi:outer membrane protein assembly factor BamD
MIKAYEVLEMQDLRDDAERVMRINFPESQFLKELPKVGALPWWVFWR